MLSAPYGGPHPPSYSKSTTVTSLVRSFGAERAKHSVWRARYEGHLITGGLEVNAENVTSLNTEEWRVIGGVRLLQGSNFIINQNGEIIRVANGQDEFTNPAITGSSGFDVVIDFGLIADRGRRHRHLCRR